MKYMGMPWGMWALFAGSFHRQLTAVLGYDEKTARAITDRAHPKYREIIAPVISAPEEDCFWLKNSS